MPRQDLKKWSWLAGVILLCIAAYIAAQSGGDDATGDDAKPATADAKADSKAADPEDAQATKDDAEQGDDAVPRVKATQVVTLRKHVGKQVTIFGKVESTAASRNSGMQFLNLANTELTVVCPGDAVKNFGDSPPATAYKSQFVQVTGTLKLYKGKLQLPIEQPSQVKIIDEATSNAAGKPAKQFALKQLGTNKWMSPAGLVYQGRDPQGLTRVEHIMRHAQDMPKRDGTHGVFDASEQPEVFALIDEAWLTAEKRGTRPTNEGDRSTLLVSLNRRIGYSGGRTGNSRGRPELKRVFIVFETGTKNIVTAFPR